MLKNIHENRAVYETMWKNMVSPEARDINLIRGTRIACWIV